MKKKSKVTVFTDILMLIMLFFTFLCSIISDKYTIMSKYIFLNIFSNFETNPIVEIDISRWRCKSDFSPLFSYNYPGHYSACYNNSTGNFYKSVSKEDCKRSKETFYIEGIDETPMNAWRSKVICVRRESYSNKTILIPSNQECPKDFKFCGKLNEFNDKYCVMEKYNCPIFYLEITLNNEYNKSDDTIQFKELDKNRVLLYSNNSTEKLYQEGNFIKNDFQVGVNFPCIKKNRISLFNDENVFPLILDQNMQKIGCKPKEDNEETHIHSNDNYINKYNKTLKDDEIYYYDKRYKKIDSYTISEFNIDNDLKYLNDIPNLKDWRQISDKEIILYSRPYTFPNFTCSNITQVTDIENSYSEIKVRHYIVIVLLLSNLTILCLFISILSLMKITSRNQNLVLSIIKIIQSLIFMYFIAKYILSIREKDENFKKMYSFLFSNENCIDDVSKTALENIYHFNEAIKFRELMIELIYYTGFPYFCCIIIQILKFMHKVYLRIRNKNRNKQAKGLLDILGDPNLH